VLISIIAGSDQSKPLKSLFMKSVMGLSGIGGLVKVTPVVVP
jgi:hypothetical protein